MGSSETIGTDQGQKENENQNDIADKKNVRENYCTSTFDGFSWMVLGESA